MPTETVSLEEALRRAADISVNGRSWAQALYFVEIRIAIMQEQGWTFEEWTKALEAAKARLP